MRRLTESLLQLARFDAGQEQIQRRRTDLAELARTCAERIRPLAAERNVQIQCALGLTQIAADSDRLAQVMSNAIQYNKEGGRIEVRTTMENGTAILTVSDTGVGIAAKDLPHIFDRFYRADTARSGASGRTGLGLAISKAIVEAHGGTIEVSSKPGAGTTFTVRLPNTEGIESGTTRRASDPARCSVEKRRDAEA
jgi:signal transduction histidine kinase